jgi:hypothetical protein
LLKTYKLSINPPSGIDVLYRCEARRYSYTINADLDQYGVTFPELKINWYRVTKRTPKGAWIEGDKFVLLSARKKYACETIEEAIESFRQRKKRQIKLLETQLRKAKEDLSLADPSRNADLEIDLETIL